MFKQLLNGLSDFQAIKERRDESRKLFSICGHFQNARQAQRNEQQLQITGKADMSKIKLTKKQQEWVTECSKIMGDPIGLDSYLQDGGNFHRDVVVETCRWWEGHSTTILHKLQNYSVSTDN